MTREHYRFGIGVSLLLIAVSVLAYIEARIIDAWGLGYSMQVAFLMVPALAWVGIVFVVLWRET